VAIDLQAFADALFKLAAVSPSEARESMERLEHLEDAAPTAGQAARYATIGAIAGPTVRVATNLIRKKKPFDFGQAPDAHALRGLAADMVGGATMSGAIPMVRNHADRAAETHKLKEFMKGYTPPPAPAGEVKAAFWRKGAIGKLHHRINFDGRDLDKQLLNVGLDHAPEPEDAEYVKKAGAMSPSGLTPAARLASAKRIGAPKISAPMGPSIADIAKPSGFGTDLPGAKKTIL